MQEKISSSLEKKSKLMMKVPINEESVSIKSKFNKNKKSQDMNMDLHRAELVFVDYDNEAYYISRFLDYVDDFNI